MNTIPQNMEQALEKEFGKRGYSLDDFRIDLFVMSEFNQVLTVCDRREDRHIDIPIEDNVLNWPSGKIARTVADAIDGANMAGRAIGN